MDPFELRERLMKEVPEVNLFPILTASYYSEEQYQEVKKNQLKLKKEIEDNKLIHVPYFSFEEKKLRMEEFYDKGWYKPKTFAVPKSLFEEEK